MSRYRYGYSYGNYGSSRSQHDQRILRAFEQPLQLTQCRYFPRSQKWELHVSSSTGRGFYELTFSTDSGGCTCPDFERRGKPCKHMLCVLLRVLKLKDQEFTSVKQVGKSYEEITSTLLRLFHHDRSVEDEEQELGDEAQTTTRKRKRGKGKEAKTKKKGKKGESSPEPLPAEGKSSTAVDSATTVLEKETPAEEEHEEMCIICLLEFKPNAEMIVKCTADCQRWLGHKECLKAWFDKSSLCPLCKGVQKKASSSSSSTSRSGGSRYHRDWDVDEVDIAALQSQEAAAASSVPTNAFFEIVRE
jgi:hypothetical protein